MAKLKLKSGIYEVARAVRVEAEHRRELVLRSDRVVVARDTYIGYQSERVSVLAYKLRPCTWHRLGRLKVFVSPADWCAAKRQAGWTVTEVRHEK